MQVYLDDIAVPVPNAALPEAIEAVRTAASARGRIVIEVLCDGRPAPPGFLEGDRADSSAVQEIRCRSADPIEIVVAMLDDACIEIDGLISSQHAAKELLWIGSTPQALEELRGVLDTWRLLRDTLEQCASALDLPLSQIGADRSTSASELLAALSGNLETLRTELAAGRLVELADLLGTELSELAREWRIMLERLARSLDADEPQAGSSGAGATEGRP